MGKPVIIVESPAKTRTIGHFVGDGYQIVASMGHVRDLPPKEFGVNLEHDFAPTYETIAERKKTLTDLRRVTKDADEVYLATDPDREGEAIAWHLVQALKIPRPKRIEFNEITRTAVQQALAHPRDLDLKRVNAQQARRILDRLVGYKLSPLLQRKLRKQRLSAGRVQSVAVRLVCEREREILAFKPEEYWNIFADVTSDTEERRFRAKLIERDGVKVEKVKVGSEAEAKAVVEAARGSSYQVAKIARKEQMRKPPAPLITSTLQQEASSRLGFGARKTMMVAQQLYEGLEIGDEGTVGLITYMRTDSMRVAAEAEAQAREFIGERFGADYVPAAPPRHKARKGAQEAHEAIRPTSVLREPEQIARYLTPDQRRLYEVIWKRFVASQMSAARLDVTTVDVAADGMVFRAVGQWVKFSGFMAVYEVQRDEDQEAEEGGLLPELSEGQALALLDLLSEQKFTQPPPRYSEASLIRALEANGIGRPSTYAPILATILDRGYVYLEQRRFRPTDLGFVVTDQLVEHFPEIVNVEFTAAMENELDRVEEGQADWVGVLREFYGPFATALEKAATAMKPPRMPAQPTDEICEKCGKPMVIRVGKRGPFLACTGFPECRNARPVPGSEEAQRRQAAASRPAPEPTGEVCEKCGSPMVIRSSRRGPFLACSAYPRCRNAKPLPEALKDKAAPEPTGEICDQCGKPMVMRRSRRGAFLGCSGYPKCRNTKPLKRSGQEETS